MKNNMQTEMNNIISVSYNEEELYNVKSLYKSWLDFLALSLEQKKILDYEGGVGYETKNAGLDSNTFDFKDNMHITMDYIKSGKLDSHEFYDLKESSAKVLNQTIDLINRSIVKLFPDSSDQILLDIDDLVIRLLYYPPQKNKILASAHIDKGLATLHLLETRPGFQYMNQDKEWQDITLSDNKGVFFVGFQGQYISDNKVKALPHRVVSTNENDGRHSIVIFCDYGRTEKYNKQDFGRLADMEPGSNFDLSLQDLKKRFTN